MVCSPGCDDDFPYFLSNAVFSSIIQPASWPGHFAKHPIGTGPFKLVEYVPGQRARYVRNPDYWQRGLPYLDGVEILLGLSPDAQTKALLDGSADVARQMWKPVGITVKLATEPGEVYYNTDWLQTPLNITDWAARPMPSQVLDLAYRSSGGWNAAHWVNPTFDRLTRELDATLDLGRRKAIVKRIELLMTEEVPAIVPYFISAVRAMRATVQGVNADNGGALILTHGYVGV